MRKYVDPTKRWWCSKLKKYFHWLGIARHRRACDGVHWKDNIKRDA